MRNLRPVRDIRTEPKRHRRIGTAVPVVNAFFVDGIGVAVRLRLERIRNIRRRRQHAAVLRRRGDRARIHQRDRRNLSLRGLGALAVREVARGMPDRKRIVRRRVARAEARPAEAGLHHRARRQERFRNPVAQHGKVDRCGCRIDRKIERAVSDAAALQNRGGFGQVFVHAAGAADDHALLAAHVSVCVDAGKQIELYLGRQSLLTIGLTGGKDRSGIALQRVDRQRLRRMERQRDHALDLVQPHRHHRIVVRAVRERQRTERFRPADRFIVILHGFVRDPDRAEAAHFGRHDVDADPVVHAQRPNAGACKLENLVFHQPFGEQFRGHRQRDVVRADAPTRRAFQPDQNDFRRGDVPGVFQKLLDELAAAFADAHRAVAAVTRVRIRAEQHPAAARQLFACVLVNDRLIRRHIDAAVLLRGGQAERVVVLIDRPADRAKAVMTVRQRVRHREPLQPRRARGLNNADIGDIVRDQRVEPNPERIEIVPLFMRAQDPVRDRFFAARSVALGRRRYAVFQPNAGCVPGNAVHTDSSFSLASCSSSISR